MPLKGTTRAAPTAPLSTRLPDGASAAQVAAALGRIALELDAALTPIIGPRGVQALWQRSLHLTAIDHAWLSSGQGIGLDTPAPALLEAAVAQRNDGEAAAAVHALLLAFHDLLASLIGLSLTERLLRTVWAPSPAHPSSGLPAQDSTP